MSLRLRLGLFALLSCACSWSRFDDVTSDTPVVVLERPGDIRSGFGTALSSVTVDDRALLLVHGATGRAQAALFDLGTADAPLTSALSESVCSSDLGRCFLASSSAPLATAKSPSGAEYRGCFAVGVGKKGTADPGVIVECEDRTVFVMPVPDEYRAELDPALELGQPEEVALVSDDAELPAIAAVSASAKLAWYYAGTDAAPVLLSAGESEPRDFAEAVAIARVGEQRLVVVGSPKQSRLDLFSVEPGGDPVHRGCISGQTSFGRKLAVGQITADAAPEIAVSDLELVSVLDSTQLLGFQGPDDGSCSELEDLPGRTLYATVACKETGAVTGCGASDFGVALAIGDVDGDGDGELVVGAPGMKARDTSTAGAVAFFDLDDPGDTEVADLKFIGSAKSGDFLGQSLVAPRVGGRHVVAAGVPGSGRTALFYCPRLLPASLGGDRCH